MATDKALDMTEPGHEPAADWADVMQILGAELLSEIVGTSEWSLRKIVSGEANAYRIPERLDWMAQLVTDLLRARSPSEICEWFEGRDPNCWGACPRDILGGDFDIVGEATDRVRRRAAVLIKTGKGKAR